MLEADFSDVLKAAAEIGGKGAAVVDAVEPVMERAAVNLKKAMAEEFAKSGPMPRKSRKRGKRGWNDDAGFRGISRDISYDRIGLGTRTIGYEIGPTPTMDAGSLAGIAVEGGANGGGGRVKIDHLVDVEAPKTEAMLMAALGFL